MKLADKMKKLVGAYVQSLVIGDDFLFVENSELAALKEVLLGIHGEYVQDKDVNSLIIRTMAFVELDLEGRSGSLSEEANADIRTIAEDKLVACFASLPRKYELRVELPMFPDVGEYSVRIAEGLTLIAAKYRFDEGDVGGTAPYTNQLANALLATMPPSGIKTFVLFEFEGYASSAANSPAVERCLSQLKQLAFILSASGIWHTTFVRRSAKATLVTIGLTRTSPVELPNEIARMCGVIAPHPDHLVVPAGLILGGSRDTATDEERAKAITEKALQANRFFSKSAHADFKSLAAAMEWYQDSLFSNNQTFAYLAACIGLEALLGSNEHLDTMSKRLGDRYAFLMGTGRVEREKFRKQYADVLDLRGKLVHAREPRLNAQYAAILRDAQSMLLNVIWKELRGLYV